jgi:hypothetical protein
VSGPAGREAREPAAYPGLLSALMAAVRPGFRSEVLGFDPRDPVFGGLPCLVDGCERPGRNRALCRWHYQQWLVRKPDCAEFVATADPEWQPRTLRTPGAGLAIPRSLPPAVGAAAGRGGAPAAKRGRTTWRCSKTTVTLGHEEGQGQDSLVKLKRPKAAPRARKGHQRNILTRRGFRSVRAFAPTRASAVGTRGEMARSMWRNGTAYWRALLMALWSLLNPPIPSRRGGG